MTLSPTSSRFTQTAADALYVDKALVDAKGDLVTATAADTPARLAVGADGLVLTAASGQATGLSWAAGGGLVTELFDSTLSGAAATIDSGAGGFSTSLNDLVVVLYLRSAEAAVTSTGILLINNDSGANYDRQTLRVTNATVAGAIALAGSAWNFNVLGANALANSFSASTLIFPNYAGTTGFKQWSGGTSKLEDTAADCQTTYDSGQWRSTSAISRIAVSISGGSNLVAGSRMTIYGIG